MDDYKMVIVMRTDLNMRKGKMITQGGHAAVMPFLASYSSNADERIDIWVTESGMAKICVGVESQEALEETERLANAAGLEVHVITDAGLTEFHGVPTKTCLAIGPNLSSEIDKITGSMRLL